MAKLGFGKSRVTPRLISFKAGERNIGPSRFTLRPLRFVALLLVLGAVTLPAWSSDLVLPRSTANTLAAAIERGCAECLLQGLSPCGTADIQVGKRYAKQVFQGKPRRGYLVSFVMRHAQFRTALVDPDRARVEVAMIERFNRARLIVVEDGFGTARVLPAPDTVIVQYSADHHRCLGIDKRSWSCCLGDGGSDRSCLPKANAPRVHLSWQDIIGGEVLAFTYVPMPGFSLLERRNATGTTTQYYCLTDDAGNLKGR